MAKIERDDPPQFSQIQNLFDQISPKYDKFNKWTSLGRDEFWRKCAIAPITSEMTTLDIGTGTGDLAFELYKKTLGSSKIVGLDFSEDMLKLAEEKRKKYYPDAQIEWIADSAENLPIGSQYYDAIVSAFVLRNLYPKIDKIIHGIFNSLKRGGIISFIDLTEPENAFLRWGSKLYMQTIVALMGVMCFGSSSPTSYLQGSMKRFFRANQFRERLKNAGFVNVKSKAYLFGAVTHYTAVKP